MSSPPPDPPTRPPPQAAWREFARAPLVPVAVAVTVGLVADRYGPVPLPVSLFAAAGGLVGWFAARPRASDAAAVWLWLAAAALAAAHHHDRRHTFAPDDVGRVAPDHPTPVRLRGVIDDEPAHYRATPDPLLTIPRGDTTVTTLKVTSIATADGWATASGRVRVTVDGEFAGVHQGDVVEVVGLLARPRPPLNPGEFDRRGRLLDDRVTAELHARRSADAVTRLDEGWRDSTFGWLAVVRGWGGRSLREALPPREAAVAAALLLGDGTAMDRTEWDAFVRTGVVHVLAISGQHLVVLAGFVWLIVRVADVRRRHAAWLVAGVMIGYALLTGAKPSAVRAAVMVAVVCGGIVLRRPVVPANAFALAWVVVAAVNPTDPFTTGCQLSFLSVFVLIWGVSRWFARRPPSPAEQLIGESRTLLEKVGRCLVRATGVAFGISLVLGAVNAPLVIAQQNIVSPVGVLLGPPLVLLTSIALIAGFLLLLASPLGAWAAWPFAQLTRLSLAACEGLVSLAEQLPGGWVYAPAPSMWWLVGFYAAVTGVVLLDGRPRLWVAAGLAAWVLGGLALPGESRPADELRVAFLAVGNGGCVVLEAPDGRTVLYDAGTIAGPDVTRRVIAPYLWSRGVRRVDEVFVSHADLDHYNGLPALLDRFPVGQVTLTPSFRSKPVAGVGATLAALDRQGVPVRAAKAGDRFDAGDVSIEVLHPPNDGPSGEENARSMVLLVRHAGHTILLTGDLDATGQAVATRRPVPPVDVMLAPHHGAATANAAGRDEKNRPTPGLMAAWARPRFVVSSQGAEPGPHLAESYGAVGAPVWGTSSHGAVTVRSHPSGLLVESFRTGEVKVIRRGQ